MSAATSIEHQVPVEGLADLHHRLVKVLLQSGLNGTQIDQALSGLSARCVQCGIVVTLADLAQVAIHDRQERIENAKLDRLRLGYCARNGCRSHYYFLEAGPGTEVDWTTALRSAGQLVDGEKGEENPSQISAFQTAMEWGATTWRQLSPRDRGQALVFAGLVLILGVILWNRSGLRVPGLSPKPRVFIVEKEASQEGWRNGQPRR